jgi:hypothetical protein
MMFIRDIERVLGALLARIKNMAGYGGMCHGWKTDERMVYKCLKLIEVFYILIRVRAYMHAWCLSHSYIGV